MLIVAAVFVGVLAIILGAYFLGVVRDEKRVLDRLQPRRETREAFKGVLKPEERMSSVGPIQTLLVRVAPMSVPLKLLIDQAGLRWNLSSVLLLSLCLALITYLLVVAVSGFALLGLGAGMLVALAPMAWVRRVRDKRMLKFEEQFPEAIDLMARALRAGHSLPTGLGMVADELTEPVGTEFRMMFDEQNFGLTLPDALRNFARRVPVIDAKFFVTAVLTQRESGGNLAEVLDNLASVIRGRFTVRRQIRVISAHGRISGLVLALLPPALALAMLVVNPAHLRMLVTDPLGVQMIAGAVVLQITGAFVIRRIVNVEYESVSLELMLTLVAVFGAVAFGVGAIAQSAMAQFAPERRRLERAANPTSSGVFIGATALSSEPSAFVQKISSLSPRSPKEAKRLRRRMVRAGLSTSTPVGVYTVTQGLLPVVLGLLPLAFGPLRSVWLIMLAGAIGGYLIPGLLLDAKISSRQKIIRNGLPDALDLLIVCLEAGSAMDQAIVKVSNELALAYPPLAEELKLVITETRAGKPRLEAFRALASRTGVDDVRALVAMLVQTDRFGTSVSQALRTHADSSRTKRRQRAEERAAKIGVKMVFPLVFLLFPAFFVVTIGPAIVQIVRVLFNQVLVQ